MHCGCVESVSDAVLRVGGLATQSGGSVRAWYVLWSAGHLFTNCTRFEPQGDFMHNQAKQTRSPDIQQCIEECQQCHAICVETLAYCLNMGGAHAQPHHLAILLDCAELCHLSEDSIRRDSAVVLTLCAACADVCNACATECETFIGDAQMKACADRCRSCATACRKMAPTRP